MEIAITIVILSAAVYIFAKNMKKKSSSQCNCGSCSAHCPSYKATKQPVKK